VGATPVGFEIETLRERLRRQLRELGDRFQSTGQRSYILVDGLDHVERIVRPGSARETLLDYLPDPDEVPDGVFVILGTQRTEVVPQPVRGVLASSGRVVNIKPLPRADVLRLATESEVVPAGAEETVYGVSNGHPLIVAYVIAGLEGVAEAEREEWLAQLPAVDGDVLALYRSYWSDVEHDDDTVELLAHIARWRGPIDLEWFAAWLDPTAIRRVRRTAAHFFRKESVSRWYFFHESFRVFLLERTVQAADGARDDRIALRYHRRLADQCAAASEGPIRWEQLHHLIEAGDEVGALALAHPTEFRAQAHALRALEAIRTDIREAARVAVRRRDLNALARLMLAAHELGQREYHLEWSENLAVLLIELGEEEIALDHLRGDFALRESKNVALRAALLLLERGFDVEARRLFDLAEPLDLLRGEPEHYFRGDAEIDTLFAWAEVAPYFRPLASIAETIRALRAESFGFRGREDPDLARHYRAQLLAFAGVGGLYAGHAEEVDAVLEQFDRADSEDATAWMRLVVHRFRIESEYNASARERLDAALREVEPRHLAGWMRLRVAEQLYHLGDFDGSRTWIASVDPPSAPDGGGVDEGARPFMPLLRFHRLGAALASPIDPETVAEPRNSHYTLVSLGIRAIVRLANVWGSALARRTTADEFLAEVTQIIRVLDRRAGRDDLGWYAIEAAKPELLSLVVHAAAAVGTEALEHAQTLFRERWLNKNPPNDDEVRRVLLAFLEHTGSETWIGDELSRYEPEMLRDKDVTGQIDACFAQARAWLQLGRLDKATELTLLGVARSSGVGYRKDYQLNTWIELMGPLLRESAQEADVEWLARALARLDESTEGRASALATEELLRQTAAAHPRAAVRILRTLPGQGVLSEWEALAAFLEGLAAPPENALAWLCLAEILVATARSAEVGSIRALAEATESDSLRLWLETVNDRLGVHALPTTRLYWGRGLAAVAAGRALTLDTIGLTADDLEPSGRAPRSIREEPSSSESSPADDVRTPADLLAILEEDSVDDYRLQAAVERVVDQLDREEVIRVANAFRATDRAALILALLARRLAALGDTATGRAFAEQAIAAGRPSGWVPYIDGGTRIRPLEALAYVDASAARERLWELLERDAEDESFNPGGLADSFEALVAIVDEGQAIPIASDVREHVRSLLGAVSVIDDLVSADDVATVDVAAACAAVLVDNLVASDAIRADAGARACVDAARAGDESILQRLAAAAPDGGEATRRVLHVLAASALLSGPAEPALSALREVTVSAQSEEDRRLAEALFRGTRGRGGRAARQIGRTRSRGIASRVAQPARSAPRGNHRRAVTRDQCRRLACRCRGWTGDGSKPRRWRRHHRRVHLAHPARMGVAQRASGAGGSAGSFDRPRPRPVRHEHPHAQLPHARRERRLSRRARRCPGLQLHGAGR
jgi:hypothetical protein